MSNKVTRWLWAGGITSFAMLVVGFIIAQFALSASVQTCAYIGASVGYCGFLASIIAAVCCSQRRTPSDRSLLLQEVAAIRSGAIAHMAETQGLCRGDVVDADVDAHDLPDLPPVLPRPRP